MKLFCLLLLLLSSCQKDKINIIGKYYPNQYRPELNLSQASALSVSSATLRSGDEIQVTLISVDSNNQSVNYGGGRVNFFIQESGTAGSFSTVVDNNSGIYTSVFTAVSSGNFTLKARVNYAKNSMTIGNIPIKINPGPLSLENSKIFLSKTLIKVGESLVFTLTLNDIGGNLYDDGSLIINPTLLDGTSSGNFTSVNYIGNGKYEGKFTGSGKGTPTHINLSIRYQGSVYSSQTVEVVP